MAGKIMHGGVQFGGFAEYERLSYKPKVNGVTLIGDKSTTDLGIVKEVTLEEYNALTPDLRNDPDILYYIKDADPADGSGVKIAGKFYEIKTRSWIGDGQTSRSWEFDEIPVYIMSIDGDGVNNYVQMGPFRYGSPVCYGHYGGGSAKPPTSSGSSGSIHCIATYSEDFKTLTLRGNDAGYMCNINGGSGRMLYLVEKDTSLETPGGDDKYAEITIYDSDSDVSTLNLSQSILNFDSIMVYCHSAGNNIVSTFSVSELLQFTGSNDQFGITSDEKYWYFKVTNSKTFTRGDYSGLSCFKIVGLRYGSSGKGTSKSSYCETSLYSGTYVQNVMPLSDDITEFDAICVTTAMTYGGFELRFPNIFPTSKLIEAMNDNEQIGICSDSFYFYFKVDDVNQLSKGDYQYEMYISEVIGINYGNGSGGSGTVVIGNPLADADYSLQKLQIGDLVYEIAEVGSNTLLFRGDGISNPQLIELNDQYTAYDLLIFRNLRSADNKTYKVDVTYDTKNLNVNDYIQGFGLSGSSNYWTYQITDEDELTFVDQGSNWVLYEIYGVKNGAGAITNKYGSVAPPPYRGLDGEVYYYLDPRSHKELAKYLNMAGEWVLISGEDPTLRELIPTMTSDTTPSGEVTYSSQYGSAFAAYMAFNGQSAASDMSGGWLPDTDDTAPWIVYDWGTLKQLYLLRIETANNGPSTSQTIYVEGLTSDGVYENCLIDEQQESTSIRFVQNEWKTYDIYLNEHQYTAIRIRGTANWFELWGKACTLSKAQCYTRN